MFKVNKCARNATTSMPSGGTIRRYFIAAEEKLWNYAPSGLNKITGESLTQPGRYFRVIITRAVSNHFMGIFVVEKIFFADINSPIFFIVETKPYVKKEKQGAGGGGGGRGREGC